MIGASARYSCFRIPVETSTAPYRRSKVRSVHNACLRRHFSSPLPCSSSSRRDPLCWAPAGVPVWSKVRSVHNACLRGHFSSPLPCSSSSRRDPLCWAPAGVPVWSKVRSVHNTCLRRHFSDSLCSESSPAGPENRPAGGRELLFPDAAYTFSGSGYSTPKVSTVTCFIRWSL